MFSSLNAKNRICRRRNELGSTDRNQSHRATNHSMLFKTKYFLVYTDFEKLVLLINLESEIEIRLEFNQLKFITLEIDFLLIKFQFNLNL